MRFYLLICFVSTTLFLLYVWKFPFRSRLYQISNQARLLLPKKKGIKFYQLDISNSLVKSTNHGWTVVIFNGTFYVYVVNNNNKCPATSDFGYLLNPKTGSLTDKCLIPLKNIEPYFTEEHYLKIIPLPQNWQKYDLLDVINFLSIKKRSISIAPDS